jgi:hypothetical protein
VVHQDGQHDGRSLSRMTPAMPLPLEGITILDFSTLLPGPLATFSWRKRAPR